MVDLKINENYQEFSKTYKPSQSLPFISFQNSHLSYEISKAELQNPVEFSTKKSFFVKKITPNVQKLSLFETFLDKMLDLQNNTETPGLLRLRSVYKQESSYILVQRDYNSSLTTMTSLPEIEILNILKDIVKFYSQIKDEDVFALLLDHNFPLKPLNSQLVFLYRKVPKTNKLALTKSKLKIDLLNFCEEENLEKLEAEQFHLKEFEKLCCELIGKMTGKLGICSRSLLRKMKEQCLWKDLFLHPLFNVDIANKPDFNFWAINNEDKIQVNEKTAIKGLKNEGEEEKKNDDSGKLKNIDKTVREPTQKAMKFNVETLKNDEIGKGNGFKKHEENMDLEDGGDKGISKSKFQEPMNIKLGKNKGEIKKSQVLPSSKDRNIIYEDHENRIIGDPNERGGNGETISLNNKNQVKNASTTCGECRCI